jgi:site-specific recombinase XerD
VEIFFTDYAALAVPVDGLDADEARRRATEFRGRFVPEGMPFVLNDDGSYEWTLNRFLRSLPTSNARSPKTWRAYAYDLVTWARFLAEHRGARSVLDATREDLDAFYAARRLSGPEYRIESSSWSRLNAALEKFYRWALNVGLLEGWPFSYGRLQPSGELSVVGAREKRVRRGDVKFLSARRYLAFRDVGLRGYLPGGGQDASFASRCGARNGTFADLCATTGLRLEEANSLLACELPEIDTSDGARSERFELAPLITKGDRGRFVNIPHRVLRGLRDYVEAERCVAVQRALSRGFPPGSRWTRVLEPDRRGGRMLLASGRWSAVEWVDLDPSERSRLLHVDQDGQPVGPLALWLSEQGLPMAPRTWESAFERASHRCRRLGLDIDASPHTMRHTFAVHLLTELVRQLLASAGKEQAADMRLNAYRRVMGDPLAHLQKLLGHSRITTTYVYLDSIGEAQELIDEAVGELARKLEGSDVEELLAELTAAGA